MDGSCQLMTLDSVGGCNGGFETDLHHRVLQIASLNRTLKQANSIELIIHDYELIIEQLRILLRYEEHNIPTISPFPSEQIGTLRNEIALLSVRNPMRKLEKAFEEALLDDLWAQLSKEEREFLVDHLEKNNGRGLTTSNSPEYLLPNQAVHFLAGFLDPVCIYYLKDDSSIKEKFEKKLSELGGEYFYYSSKIAQLLENHEEEEAKALFFGPFLSKLFPSFIRNTINEYHKWDISGVKGWDAFIEHLIDSGSYVEAISLIAKMSSLIGDTGFSAWVETPLPWIETVKLKIAELIERLEQGEEIIQSNYKKEYDNAYSILHIAEKQGIVRREKFKRSFRILLTR